MGTKKKTKRKYVAGLAQLNFKVAMDWDKESAAKLYAESTSQVPKNTITFTDCVISMQKMPDASVDLIIADPPFGIDFSGKGGQYNRKAENVIDGYVEIEGSYATFSDRWITCLPRIMKPTATAYIISGWTHLGDILNSIEKAGLVVLNHIVWKYQFGVFTKKKFVSSHYHILFVAKDEKAYFFNKYQYYPEDVWEISRAYKPGQLKNGTKLPEELVNRIIQFSSKPGDTVLDPFMGNATTAVCAKGLYRNYYGFELNEKLKDIHENNLKVVELGDFYQPLNELLPSTDELLSKYPHLKKYVDEDNPES